MNLNKKHDYEVVKVEELDISLIVDHRGEDEDMQLVNYYYGDPNELDTKLYIKQKESVDIELVEFRNHLHESVNSMLDEMADTNEYNEQYDVTMSVNGKSVTIGLNADLYDSMLTLIKEQIGGAVNDWASSGCKSYEPTAADWESYDEDLANRNL